MRMREKLAWGAAGALAVAAVLSAAGVALGGSLDPPGPPAPTGPIVAQLIPETPPPFVFTTVVANCGSGSQTGVDAAAASAATQLNVLGADRWSLVGPPEISFGAGGQCSLTYTLQRRLDIGTPLPIATSTQAATNTPTAGPTNTSTSTPTAIIPS
jgi:hypothetical protein